VASTVMGFDDCHNCNERICTGRVAGSVGGVRRTTTQPALNI
jgi:hypothetical protein